MRIISESQADDVLLKEIAEKANGCGVSSVEIIKNADAVGVSVWSIEDISCALDEDEEGTLKKWENLTEAAKITVAQQLFSSLLEANTEDVFIGIRGTIEDLLDEQEHR